MAEPPTKRARRTDSSAMWDRTDNSRRSFDREPRDRSGRAGDRDGGREGDFKRGSGRDDRRYRSRSRERVDKHRNRSRSTERDSRNGGRDRRDREDHGRVRNRSSSRDGPRSRRDHPSSKQERYRDRSRSRSPLRNGHTTRARSPPRGPRSDKPKDIPKADLDRSDINGKSDTRGRRPAKQAAATAPGDMEVDQNGPEDDEEAEMAQLRKVMGFTSFKTTQNKKVPGNNVYGVRKEKKTEYRQYMNRQGGFNRPLSPSR